MNDQVVEFVQLKKAFTFHDVPGTFSIRPDRPAVWLQRACAWVMGKLGAFSRDETVLVTRHVIRADTFVERLFKQRRELMAEFNQEPSELLIGVEDYQELMQSPEIENDFSFRAEYYTVNDDAPYGKVLGLTVRVIPWMRGVLVMPTEKRVRPMTQENEEAK